MQTSAQARETLDAVMRERARCAVLVDNAIRRIKQSGAGPGAEVVAALEDLLDRVRRPWKVRCEVRRRRARRCCGRCGGDDHTAPSPRCPARSQERAP
jgi:hypothetical protein